MRGFHPKLGIESLLVQPISRSSARQRSGRAGRQTHGACFRLYTEDSFFKDLTEETIPEIHRVQLSDVVLLLKACNVDNLHEFPFMDAPPHDALKKALEELYALGALDSHGKLTKLGKKMADFPVEPKLAKVLLKSQEFGNTETIIDVVALLSVENLFIIPSFRNETERERAANLRRTFSSPISDHLTLLNVFKAYLSNTKNPHWCEENYIHKRAIKQVLDIRQQLKSFCEKFGLDVKDSNTSSEAVLQCFLAGFFRNVAFLQNDGTYKTLLNNRSVSIHPSSLLVGTRAPCVMFSELTFTTKSYLRNVSSIEPFWMTQAAPHYFGNLKYAE
jgi:HrpA-like RNA helicase